MTHHPDRNRSDPNASQRFARISAAYNVLGNASKRAVYDRDNGIHQIHASSAPGHTHAHPMGSHSSHSSHSSYAGSRPASGLSKRRSTFHGPPPSFYDQGGYGATGRQGDGSATGPSGFGAGFGSGTSGASAGRSADPEDWEGFIRRNPLHHFNARGHFRTQAAEDKRRRERASAWRGNVSDAEWPQPEPGAGSGLSFTRFLVSLGCLVLAGASAGLWPSPMPGDERKMARQRESLS
jgi:curved DNA-binding protein CbpA